MVMDVESPATDIGDIDVESLQSGRLRLPYHRRTSGMLIANRDPRLRHAVHLLLVNVPLVPCERVRQIRVSLVRFRVKRAFDLHVHVYVRQRFRNERPGQLHPHGREIARSLTALIHQVEIGARNSNAFLHDLQAMFNVALMWSHSTIISIVNIVTFVRCSLTIPFSRNTMRFVIYLFTRFII